MRINQLGIMSAMDDDTTLIYARVGGPKPFWALVEEFYQGVENCPLLRQMYPDELAPAKERLALFLIQRFGGPTEYNDKRGHPRLRMRHIPFHVDLAARDAWLRSMDHALDAVSEFAPFRQLVGEYFANTATFLVNQPASRSNA